MSVGERIREYRLKKGMKLKELAKAAGISVSYLSDIENSKSNVTIARLLVISEALNCTIDCLIGEKYSSYIYKKRYSYIDQLILKEIEQVYDWDESDKQELLHYLRIKHILRVNR